MLLGVCNEKNVVGIERSVLHDVVCIWWSRLSPYALAFLLFMAPQTAYAEPSIEVNGNYAGTENGQTYKGYVVVGANSAYKATLTLTEQWFQLIEITTEKYNKLMSPSTGGRFYELCQLWEVCGTSANGQTENYPNWISMTDFYIDGLNTVYGYGNVWECVCTDALISGARQDLVTILEGGDVGGGGGDEEQPFDGTLTFTYTGNGSKAYGDGFTATTVESVADKISSFEGCVVTWGETNNVGTVWIWEVPAEFELVYEGDRLTGLKNTSDNNYNIKNYGVTSYDAPSNGVARINGMYSSSYPHLVASGSTYNFSNILYISEVHDTGGGGEGGGGGGTTDPEPDPDPPTPQPPVNPRVPAPREPVLPDPPDLPDPPQDPELPEPEPTPNPPQHPTVPTPNPPQVSINNSYTVDLQGILDAMDEHCQHIQENINANTTRIYYAIYDCFLIYYGLLTEFIQDVVDNINQHMSNLTEVVVSQIGDVGEYIVSDNHEMIEWQTGEIKSGFDDLIDYFGEYVDWLDKKLNFKWPDMSSDYAPYDDTSLLYWLKRIYTRLGSGIVSTKPVDPVHDTQGTLEWLLDLLRNLLGDVAGKIVGALGMGDMLTAMGELTSYFPVSIPWDIYAVVDLLDAEPVTPVFDLPLPTGYSARTVTVHVDLTPWNGVAAVCRQGSVILFAVGLMWRIKSMVETIKTVTDKG